MAIVQLTSTNPQFTFLIRKNPGSGMLLRPIRQGTSYGWYSDHSTFNVYFKDADNGISYKKHEQDNFEYLNVSRYNTPIFSLNAINEYFSSPFKAQDERDSEGFKHTFFINMIHVQRSHYIDFFQKHMPEYEFSLQHQSYKSYSLAVSTKKSLYHLLHTVSVLCLFLSMFGEEYIDISDEILDKYIRSLNVIDAPFYIRSLFARNFLVTRERFGRYKSEIERTNRYQIELQHGSTAHQRRSYIKSLLKFDLPILDIGCGEGFYAIPFASKLESMYYAIDINEELHQVVERKAAAKEIDNIALYSSIDHYLETYNGEQVDIILTEVIEHMTEDEASALIRQICAEVSFRQLIVTTPNADFNAFYEIDGFRHDDHKWEMGQARFRQWFGDMVAHTGLNYEFVDIGDRVNGVHTTQGVIIHGKVVQL